METEEKIVCTLLHETSRETGLSHKLSWKTKVGFGFGHFFNDLCLMLYTSYLLVFLTQVVGVTPVNAGIMFLVVGLVDGVVTLVNGRVRMILIFVIKNWSDHDHYMIILWFLWCWSLIFWGYLDLIMISRKKFQFQKHKILRWSWSDFDLWKTFSSDHDLILILKKLSGWSWSDLDLGKIFLYDHDLILIFENWEIIRTPCSQVNGFCYKLVTGQNTNFQKASDYCRGLNSKYPTDLASVEDIYEVFYMFNF